MNQTKSNNSSVSKVLLNELKKLKSEQRQAIREIKEEIKKSDQFRISIDGLEKLSNNSISSIQNKREKSILNAKKIFNELVINTRKIKKIEDKIRFGEK